MSGPGRRTQRLRVLTALRTAGRVGITQGDFLLPDVSDGGDPITRIAARIDELRDQGVAIDKAGRRGKFDIYCLVDASNLPATPERLFEDDVN